MEQTLKITPTKPKIDKMQLTRSFYYYNTNRNKEQFDLLLKYAKISRNMYNKMLYYWDQNYDILEEILSEFDISYMFRQLKISDLYPSSRTYSPTIRMLYSSIKSYIASIKEFKKHPEKYNFNKPQKPHYLRSTQKYFNFCSSEVKVKDQNIIIKRNREIEINIHIPNKQFIDELINDGSTNKDQKNKIRYVSFIFIHKNCFKINMVYDVIKPKTTIKNNNWISLDLGIDNFAAIISTNANLKPILLDGKCIKSVNQWYNKFTAKYKSKINKSNKKDLNNYVCNSKLLRNILTKRNRKISTILHKYSTYIIKYCKQNNIDNILVGINKEWKQKFNTIPYYKFREQLKYKCELNNINYNEIEESFTSKTDNLACEKLFSKKDNIENYQFIGTRKYRGLFQSSIGKLINADVNGAIGILRKKIGDDFIQNLLQLNNIYNPIKLHLKNIQK